MKLIPALLVIALILLISGGLAPLLSYAIVFYIFTVLMPWRLYRKLWKTSSSESQPTANKHYLKKTNSPFRRAASIIILVELSCFFLYLLIIIGFMEGRQREPHIGYLIYGSVGFGVFTTVMYIFVNLLADDELPEIDSVESENINTFTTNNVQSKEVTYTESNLHPAPKSEKSLFKAIVASVVVSSILIMLGVVGGPAAISPAFAASFFVLIAVNLALIYGVMLWIKR